MGLGTAPDITKEEAIAGEGKGSEAEHILQGKADRYKDMQRYRSEVKGELVRDIAKETGLDEETINDIIYSWSVSSNDQDIASLRAQEIAASLFDTEMSDWQKEQIPSAYEQLARRYQLMDQMKIRHRTSDDWELKELGGHVGETVERRLGFL